jgi:HSP20 family molecular chaperone IbpA
MKLHHIILVFVCTLAQSLGEDEIENEQSNTGLGDKLSSTPKTHTVEEAFRDLMEDFSHMTSLHESFIHHPLISRLQMGKPFSSWGSFGSTKRWSPRYEIVDDAKKFQLKLDVPDFHFHEIDVELEAGGRFLSISGTKEQNYETPKHDHDRENKASMGEKEVVEEEGKKFEFISHTTTSFKQKFALDPSIDTALMTANLVDGVLEVRAPRKDTPRIKRRIPITQFDEDVWAELISTDEADPVQEPTVLITE